MHVVTARINSKVTLKFTTCLRVWGCQWLYAATEEIVMHTKYIYTLILDTAGNRFFHRLHCHPSGATESAQQQLNASSRPCTATPRLSGTHGDRHQSPGLLRLPGSSCLAPPYRLRPVAPGAAGRAPGPARARGRRSHHGT